MDRNLKYFFIAIILIVILLTIFGIAINKIGNQRTASLIENAHLTMNGAVVKERAIHSMADNVNIKATMPWAIDISSQIEGTILNINVSIGQRVRAGDVVAYMDNKSLVSNQASAKADIAEARVKLRNLELTASRYEELVRAEAISQNDYDAAIAQRDAMLEHISSLEAKYNALAQQTERLTLRAPKDGVVLKIYNQGGTYIFAGTPIMLIGETDNMLLRVSLDGDQVRKLLYHESDDVFTMVVPEELMTHRVLPVQEDLARGIVNNQFTVRKIEVNPDINSDSNSFVLFGIVEKGAQYLEPTTYDRVKLYSHQTHTAKAVPKKAVKNIENNNECFVYTLDENNHVVKRGVICGIKDDDYVEIVQGLDLGDKVIITEASSIVEGKAVTLKIKED